MKYVDGFLLVVPKKKVNDYKKMARQGAKIWKKYGALEYFECLGDDLRPDMGGMKVAVFPKTVKLKPGETVWFSFIVYKSKAHRDQVNKKVMKDPSMSPEAMKNQPMPFDMKRMNFGGFKAVVEA